MALCGKYCYAKAMSIGIRQEQRKWGQFIEAKTNAAYLYRKELQRIQKAKKPLPRIFMSSVTDPYVPVENKFRLTRAILAVMNELPPEKLVLQTHTPNVLRDMEILKKLIQKKAIVSVNITVETDMENKNLDRMIKTNPTLRHMYPIESRFNALRAIKKRGITSVACVSPLLPIMDPENFAKKIDECSHYVIIDHFLLGDGSNGKFTGSTAYFEKPLPVMLEESGHSEWATLNEFHRIVKILKKQMGSKRVGVSKAGFNMPDVYNNK